MPTARNHLAAGALGRGLALRGFGPADLTLAVALLLWQIHLVRWLVRVRVLGKADNEQHMYTALTLWAGVDVALIISWIF